MAIPERVGSILEGSLEIAVGKVSKGAGLWENIPDMRC